MELTDKQMQLLFDYATSNEVLCDSCSYTGYGSHNSGCSTPNGYVSCEGRGCEHTFDKWVHDLDSDELAELLESLERDKGEP